MKKASPAAQALARRLVAAEAGKGRGPEVQIRSAEQALDKLRLHCAPLVGGAGFQALLARALVLARAEFPWLAAVRVEPNGMLAGLREAAPGRDPEAAAGIAAVLAQLLGLLIRFIGAALTRQLLREIWPALSAEESGA